MLGAHNRWLSQNQFVDVKDFVMKIMKITAVKLIEIMKVIINHQSFINPMEIAVNGHY